MEAMLLEHLVAETRTGTFEADDAHKWAQLRQGLSTYLGTSIICVRVILGIFGIGSKGGLAGTSVVSAYRTSSKSSSRVASSVEAVKVRVKDDKHRIDSKTDPAAKLAKVQKMLERSEEEAETIRKRIERIYDRLQESTLELRDTENRVIELETECNYLKSRIK
ncbi:MAG: hypothetical protein MHM6MM_008844 [Cercozoa sp. M6MM]